MLRSDLHDYSDAYIVVKGKITVEGTNDTTKRNKKLAFKNNIPEIAVKLKYLSNFWRSLDFPLINCKKEIDMKWTKSCVITEVSRSFKVVDPNADKLVYELVTAKTGTAFQINNAKLYVPVVTLSINDNMKHLENIKETFKRTISWKKI